MTLFLNRVDCTPNGIFSELVDDKGRLSLITLEHSYNSLPKLYDGAFTCVRGMHQLHNGIKFETFEITGVTGHTGILFHIGNYNEDSDGCVLLGMDRTGDNVSHSAIAFSKLMALLEGQNFVTLIVKNST